MMKWHTYPEIPGTDEDGESDYLLIACPLAIVPLAGYYVTGKGFFLLGAPLGKLEPLRDVRAWARYPKLPAELFADSPMLLNHARSAGLIEEESNGLDS